MSEMFHRVRLINIRPKRGDNLPFQSGEFSFKGDVLDQLPRYFEYVDLMRKVDDDAYALFSRIGASLIPVDKETVAFDCNVAGNYYTSDMIPSFGCVYMPQDDKGGDRIGCDFIWWTKLDKATAPVIGVEHVTSPIFSVTALYHDKADAVQSITFHVTVPSFKDARVLKETVINETPMYDHRSQVDRRGYTLRRREWSYPHGLRLLSIDGRRTTPNEMGRRLFAVATTAILSRRVGFQVRVAKAGRYAVFNVDETAGPKFFSDRDVQVNENGRAKKIFHYVAGYQKTCGGMVKGHTKGLREFEWNGYSVHIGKPDFDFANPEDFTAPAVLVEAEHGRHLTMAEVGMLVQRHVRMSAWNKRKRSRKRR